VFLGDIPGDGRRHQPANRKTRHHATAYIGRTDRNQGHRDAPGKNVPDRGLSDGGLKGLDVGRSRPGSRQDGHRGQGHDLSDLVPGVERREVVLAYEEDKHGAGKILAHAFQRQDRVRRFRPGDFQVGNCKMGYAGGGQLAHPQTVGVGRRHMILPVDRRGRRDEYDAVQPQVVQGVLTGNEMAKMNRIERAAQDADAFHAPQYGRRRGGCQGSVERLAAGQVQVSLLAVIALAAVLASGTAAEDITFVEEDSTSAERGQGAAASPFAVAGEASRRKDAVPGYVELSSGLKIPGKIYTTRDKRLKIYNLKRERYEYVPAPALTSMEVTVEWERMDKEWRFKEAGNPEKVYSGREYPVRSLAWTLTLRNGHQIHGHVLGQPLYVEHNGKAERFILHQRDKGPMGRRLADLVYVRRVEFGPEAYHRAVEELKGRAEAAAVAKD